MVTPTVASIPTAEMAMPYSPAWLNETKMAPQMSSSGIRVLIMPTESPAMKFVAGPVADACAMRRMGGPAVKYSVARPISTPDNVPDTTAQNGPIAEWRGVPKGSILGR